MAQIGLEELVTEHVTRLWHAYLRYSAGLVAEVNFPCAEG